jgi:2-(1,2-epoxy-1,2-dihydrophenyl)acetyl-CoA isomerase
MSDLAGFDPGTDDLLIECADGVAVLTMNRPERLNALSPAMGRAMGQALAIIKHDDAIGAVLLTGAGRGFCAGGDVARQAERATGGGGTGTGTGPSVEHRIDELRTGQMAVSAALFELPKPVLASIGGPAAGAGMSIALACDLRIGSDKALFTTAFAKVGFSGDYGGSWYLTQLVGMARAKELYFMSDKVGAEDAQRLGLLNRLVAHDDLDAEARAWAHELAHGPRIALRFMKENINRAITADLRTALDAEAVAMTRASQTEDHREGATAFMDKRSPHFTGR